MTMYNAADNLRIKSQLKEADLKCRDNSISYQTSVDQFRSLKRR